MIFTTKELLEMGETEYSIRTKVSNGTLFLMERGIYCDKLKTYSNEIIASKKYPNAVLTGLSAFYIYDLTDQIPDKVYLATEQHSFPIRRTHIVQTYQEPSFFKIGVVTIPFEESSITIYDLERSLIELIRLKEKYPPELYYEVLSSFRKIKQRLDFYKLNNYVKGFQNSEILLRKIKEII